MSFTLCTSEAIVRKAGANASTVATASGALLADYCDQAEAVFNTSTRYDWTTNFSTAETNLKKIISNGVASLAAIEVINYDMSNFSQLNEAQTMLDVLRDQAVRAIEVVKDSKNKEKLI